MPEGPSIVILKEDAKIFKGSRVISAAGNTKKIQVRKLKGKTIKDFKSWGKHFLIVFDDVVLRIHFLLFGSYRINSSRPVKPRLKLKFKDGVLNFYACSIAELPVDLNEIYDWSADVMSKKWDAKKAEIKLKNKKDEKVCDVLLSQEIFAGVGNIIKNEVMYRIKVHPETKIKNLPVRKLRELIQEAVNYSFDFLKWKKKFVLRKHWLAHTKRTCHRCDLPIIKKYLGKTGRRTFFCNRCQVKY